jgi:LacI family transcriptional regulator
MMLARGVDALLIASCQPKLEGFYSIHHQDTPFLLVDRPFPYLRANFVGTDDCAGGRLATEHLIQLGRKRLAYIGSPDLSPAADRFRGFRDALRDHDIEMQESFILSEPPSETGDNAGYAMMQTLLSRKNRPDGVFCHNDLVAIGAMKATLDAGLSIPGDIAFVGYDNVSYCKYLQIPLTSVDQSTAQLGETAAQLALDLVGKKIDKPKTILLPPTLVVRESTIGSSSLEHVAGAKVNATKGASRRAMPAQRTSAAAKARATRKQ